MILQIPVRDLLPGGPPDIGETFGELQEIAQRPNTVRLAGDVRMQPHVEQPTAPRTFAIQLVKRFLEHRHTVVNASTLEHEGLEVVDLDRIRN